MDYLTYPIFPVTPEKPFSGGEFIMYDLVGAEYGTREFVLHSVGNNKASLQFLQENSDDRVVLTDFFLDRLGKFEPFWLRSYIPKFKVIEDAPFGSFTIKVIADNMFLRDYTNKAFVYDDILPYAAHIESAVLGISVELGQYTLITLSDTLIRDINAGESLEELYFSRFNTDTLTFAQHAYGITKCKLTFVELQQELGKVGF